MYKKISLYFQIKQFYNTFGEVIGNNPCANWSRMTNDNIMSVGFDIGEALEAYDDDTDEMTIWLNKLSAQITDYCRPKKHDYTVTFFVLLAVASVVGGCIIGVELNKGMEVVEEQTHTRYTAYGRYYTDGTVITNDGNEWSYSTDSISDKIPTDAMPVWVGFDDNGTPDRVEDDIILGLVYDRNTAIYDDLEDALSDKFQLERDGNNIHIGGIK